MFGQLVGKASKAILEWKKNCQEKVVFAIFFSNFNLQFSVNGSQFANCEALFSTLGELGTFVVEDGHLVLCGGNTSIWGVVIINGSRTAFRTHSNI